MNNNKFKFSLGLSTIIYAVFTLLATLPAHGNTKQVLHLAQAVDIPLPSPQRRPDITLCPP